jgi:hypothetical protein
MADVMFIVILIAFFGACVGFVRICDRVIGTDDVLSTAGVDDAEDTKDELAA